MTELQIIIATQIMAVTPYVCIIIYTIWKSIKVQPICRNTLFLQCCVAFVLHAIAVHTLIQYPHGWNIQFEFSISLIIAIATLVTCITQFKTNIQTIIFCHAFIAIIAILYSLTAINRPVEFVVYELGWHIALSVGAFSTFGIATLHSVLLWYYQQHLKQHQGLNSILLKQLPPLENMYQLLINFIVVCLVLLSFAIITGSWFISDLLVQQLTHMLFTLLTWLVCFSIIIKHLRTGWNSQRLIYWVWAGFAFLVLAYLGSKFVIERLL